MRTAWPKRSAYFSLAKISMISTAVIFAGCQRIPDQRRVTKLDLVDIVRNVRCEFQEVLLNGYKKNDWLEEAFITTQYTFTSNLNNNGDFVFTGFWPFRNGRKSGHIDGIVKADYDKTRKGETVLTFQEKYSNIAKADCRSKKYYRSYKYLIKGRIGVEPIVRKFHRTASIPGIKNYENYTRELEFTVKKTGSINPTYFLSPVPVQARTFDFSLIFAADRSDMHNVKITLSEPNLKFIAGIPGEVAYPDIPDPVIQVQLVGGKKGDTEIPSQVMIVTTESARKLLKDEAAKKAPPPFEAPDKPSGISGEDRALQKGINNIDRQEDRFFREGLRGLLGR